ncbi:AraC-like DNA-binding protein [Catenulispora sp. GAS73]|uniref:helix-turn-helix domain-containing protein n=1 Tax=Catenulispora sp. GAS73 TaxID=3156269 RepID=UPI0035155F44
MDVLMLHDEWLPHGFRALSGRGSGTDIGSGKMVMLHFPKAALPLRPPALAPLFARQLPAHSGLGAVLARYLASVASALEKGEVGRREGEQLGTVALDLAVMTLTAWAGVGGVTAPENRSQALLAKIETFIERNLGDPDLTPSVIAGHHHISVSHLHRLFQARELTIAAWIRHRRLECCRADLADPRHRTRPVHAIGVRWGFRSAAEFSRAFRAAYGSAPGHYRRQALSHE